MGRIVSTLFTTLDGVVESPQTFHFPYFDEAMGAAMSAYQEQVSAYLMGRRLYDEWSAYWPGNTADDFGGFINPLPKHVVSSTLTDPQWENTSVLSGSPDEVAAQVTALKADTDGVIGMSGSATTVRFLLARGLVDELELFVDPIAVGEGARLFEGSERTPLELVSSEAFGTGVLHLRYAPEGVGGA